MYPDTAHINTRYKHWVKCRTGSISVLAISPFHPFTETNYTETNLVAFWKLSSQLSTSMAFKKSPSVHQFWQQTENQSRCQSQSQHSLGERLEISVLGALGLITKLSSVKVNHINSRESAAMSVLHFTVKGLIHLNTSHWLILKTSMKIPTVWKQQENDEEGKTL